MITFYDFDGKIKGEPWNINVWKTRFSLNYKGLPYKTVWLEYPDVAETMKSIGALPTTVNPADGSPRYTIPAIFDDSTGVAIADSALIAEYLDKTYPDTPALIPKGTVANLDLTVPDVPESLNPRSAEYFRKHRAIDFGVPSLDVMRVSGQAKEEQLKKAKGVLGDFDKVMKDGDTWVMGDKPTFVDFVIASVILSVKIVCGKKSEEYREFMSWHGGRWSRMMTILEEKYSTVEL